MRRTSLCKIVSGFHLRRGRHLTPLLHPAHPLQTSIASPKPYYVPSDSNALSCLVNRRFHSGGESNPTSAEVNKAVDEINSKFVEAREEIELALESKETVYFNEEAEAARVAVKEVLDMFQGLLGRLREDEKAAMQRSMGLKIEQLKAELEQLNE
ncbi:unnamed protein product [Rhodiola kirilowii]